MFEHLLQKDCKNTMNTALSETLKGNLLNWKVMASIFKLTLSTKIIYISSPRSVMVRFWANQSGSHVPSSTILFPLSVITRMRGSWLAMSAKMTSCLFRRFLAATKSLPMEKKKSRFDIILVNGTCL